MSDINMNMPVVASFSSSYEQEELYKECRRNHAASLGRVAYDGCNEFLGGGLRADDNTRDNMLCAACNCHRSFHSKITIYTPMHQNDHIEPHNNTSTTEPAGFRVQQLNGETMVMPIPMPMPVSTVAPPSPSEGRIRKKRTLFTPEQKNRMTMFAERLGWRPQKGDKELIQDFCNEMGINRRMFLVWLSNNRRRAMQQNNNAAAPTPSTPPSPPATATEGVN